MLPQQLKPFLSKHPNVVVGIDASRCRSGGAQAHIYGIIASGNPPAYGIREVHLWAPASLLASLPDRPWLIKHNPQHLERSLAKQLWWQATLLSKMLKQANCDVLFTADASTLCRFRPMVVLSQDMLSFEPGVMRYFGIGYERVRLLAIFWLQNTAFRRAEGVIFLTKYTGALIQKSCGLLQRVAYIPHGVSDKFRTTHLLLPWPLDNERPIRLLYVSPVLQYKHQWRVVKAVELLRIRSYNLHITFVGSGSGAAQRQLDVQIAESDPQKQFVNHVGSIPYDAIPGYLAETDIFIFASSCENMPVTLLEAMASGLPIACSDRGPMPEVLEDAGEYFDPEDPDSIAAAVEALLVDPEKRQRLAARAKALSERYSWERCAAETWSFIVKTYKETKA